MDAYRQAAMLLGWEWSPAHAGYITERHRGPGLGWDSYEVQNTAEDACFADGVETDADARRVIDERS